MCVKMNAFSLILSTLCVVLVANCEETHHIDQRILNNEEAPYASGEDVNNTESQLIPSPEETPLQTDLPSNLDQVVTDIINAASHENATVSSIDGIKTTRFNVSSLLRTNGSVIIPRIKPNETDISPNVASEDNPELGAAFQPNETIAKNETGAKVDTEVKDLLNQDSQPDALVEHQHPFEASEPQQIPDKIDKQTELIEDGENTEDELRRHRNENPNDSSQGPLAIILVSMLVIMSVLCYVGLLLWRKYLENRYGSRTLLVDAEELGDPNDLRHFSI